ncbi:MAG: hypothetical protein MZV64_63695 [Ignavibacteriales bacterium]|nr:hypothetical protein [Ignavibacteriales bacterium]
MRSANAVLEAQWTISSIRPRPLAPSGRRGGPAGIEDVAFGDVETAGALLVEAEPVGQAGDPVAGRELFRGPGQDRDAIARLQQGDGDVAAEKARRARDQDAARPVRPLFPERGRLRSS